MLDLRAAIGKNDLVEIVLDRGIGLERGGDGRNSGGSPCFCRGWLRRARLAWTGLCGRLLCGLRLGLRGGRGRGRCLGLEKVLVA